jgi:hypothetical protein
MIELEVEKLETFGDLDNRAMSNADERAPFFQGRASSRGGGRFSAMSPVSILLAGAPSLKRRWVSIN